MTLALGLAEVPAETPSGTTVIHAMTMLAMRGESTRPVAKAPQPGGEVAAAAWFASRRPIDVVGAVGAPVVSIADVDMTCCPAAECPDCAAGVPVIPALDLN